ncbi:MAG: heme b synthase [Deltaproteobacteria bacterium]|nr:heme b synthase [Deltaproteobacteria bacterium]
MMKDHHQNRSNLRLVAWELTRSCNLNCTHCRASSERGPYPGELEEEKCREILDQIASVGKPIVILTGGEPLLREGVFELAEYGTRLGLRMVMATNATMITPGLAERMKASGIQRVSVSLDGPDGETHDSFRKVPGAFKRSLEGIEYIKKAGIQFQINTTVTKHNVELIPEVLNKAMKLGAAAHHLFLLVPTGRAREMVNQEIDAKKYEELLKWFYRVQKEVPFHLKATCAPHYYRILREEAHRAGEKVDFKTYGLDAVTRGCLGGIGFCFISYVGIVQPCGYLELNCGDLRNASFEEVWRDSAIFKKLRDFSEYKGKCGRCEYIRVCGGCRARAYEATGDYLEEEPLCLYSPKKRSRASAGPAQ